MVATKEESRVVRIGRIDFTVERAEHTPESRRRWENRADGLTAWLLAEWRREQEANCVNNN